MIVVYMHETRARSRIVGEAMYRGIVKQDKRRVDLRTDPRPEDVGVYEVAVFYGMSPTHKIVWEQFKAAGRKTVIIDLGYWSRIGSNGTLGGRFGGYHKVAVDYWHPTAYFQQRPMPADRLKSLGIAVREKRKPSGRAPILLVGMSRKGCDLYGIDVLSWEHMAVKELRKNTDRPIVYRPKLALRDGPRINGTEWQDPQMITMDAVLRGDVYSVVSHHSNAAIEAIVEGVPIVVADGAARPLSGNLEIVAPRYTSRDERERLCRDLAYTQWNVLEMQAGLPWRHLLSEGLV